MKYTIVLFQYSFFCCTGAKPFFTGVGEQKTIPGSVGSGGQSYGSRFGQLYDYVGYRSGL